MGTSKSIILFGAGVVGRKALEYFGKESVYGFADNNANLVGKTVNGVPVMSFETLKKISRNYEIVLSVDVGTSFVLAAQLEDAGIHQYSNFLAQIHETIAEGIPEHCRASVIHPENVDWKGKRVLMVAYQFPPLSGSGVFRSLKFAKYLSEFGWKPTVISTDLPRLVWNYTDISLVREIPEDIDVIRVPDQINTMREKSFSNRERFLLPFLQKFLQENQDALELFSSIVATRIGAIQLCSFPCYGLAWAYDVIQYIENHMDICQFDIVYTSSDPYSAHLIGAFLKKKYGVPWVADYRDVWTGDPVREIDYADPKNKLLFYLEDALLQLANRSITVEKHMAMDYVDRFHISERKTAAITNGYDEADYLGLPLKFEQPDKFTISYSGLLHVGRSIDAVLRAIQQLVAEGKIERSQLRFRIVGESRQYDPYQEAELYGLGSIVELTDYCSHQEAIISNMEANVLLLLIGDNDRYRYVYSGKIFDYLRSGRPILALAPADGVVAQTLRETGHGETYLSTDLPGIKGMILREYQKWQRGEKRELLHSPLIERFERRHLTKQLADIFTAIDCEERA